jgi:hypothetical protein
MIIPIFIYLEPTVRPVELLEAQCTVSGDFHLLTKRQKRRRRTNMLLK